MNSATETLLSEVDLVIDLHSKLAAGELTRTDFFTQLREQLLDTSRLTRHQVMGILERVGVETDGPPQNGGRAGEGVKEILANGRMISDEEYRVDLETRRVATLLATKDRLVAEATSKYENGEMTRDEYLARSKEVWESI